MESDTTDTGEVKISVQWAPADTGTWFTSLTFADSLNVMDTWYTDSLSTANQKLIRSANFLKITTIFSVDTAGVYSSRPEVTFGILYGE
jgi:hypothetical protein